MYEKSFIAGRQHGKSLERAKAVAELLSMEGIKPGEFFVLDSFAGIGSPKSPHWITTIREVSELGHIEVDTVQEWRDLVEGEIIKMDATEYKSPAELRGDFRKGLNDMMKKGRGRR